ncbi:MAG: Rv3235 family protein [Actinomycetota bacterium]|nr:Rv3235 family protein [Actinomycetota bacterium]
MTTALAGGSPAPKRTAAVRILTVRPAPRREPPFDDEIAPRRLYAVGPLDQQLPFESAARRDRPMAPPTVLRTDLPDPALWGRRLLIGIIETAAGRRPLQQLAALLSPSVAHGLGADFERAAQRRRPHWTHAATVRSVRACEPAEGVAELCATVQVGPRVRAVAMRLEAHQNRWRCTRLQLG